LDLARAQKVDLGRIAIAELVDPFVAAIATAAKTVPLAPYRAGILAPSRAFSQPSCTHSGAILCC
jgi:chromatin segregation and condensation protein Rec8/ScpA/Scc1 (kleisin family)